MDKRWTLIECDDKAVQQLQQDYNIDPLLGRLLVQRGLGGNGSTLSFFEPDLQALHDPFLMKDMDKAVQRLQRAIDIDEGILLFGDYDVDGTTSVALMYTFLERRSAKLNYYLPDRYREGYGLSRKGVDFAADRGASLIIAMDCGIKAVDMAAYAKSKGIDLIICDHHLPGEQLPEAAAILDPKQEDCPYPYKHLSGCGIAFKLVQAFEQQHNIPIEELKSLLDYLVISIASDIVPLTGENRILAYHGLKILNYTHRPGLLALIEQSKLRRPLRIRDIVFGLAPTINAAGRLENAEQAVKLMLARNRQVARDYADQLDACNRARREYDQHNAEEADQILQSSPELLLRKSIVLYQPHWHKGVIGIVASRLAERYHKPTIILTRSEDDHIVGSARSVSGYDLYQAVEACQDLLENYGGHKFAVGLTITQENLRAFRERFEQNVAHNIMPDQEVPAIRIAAELNLADLTRDFLRILRSFAPFGPGNRPPVFLARRVRICAPVKRINGQHLRMQLKQEQSSVQTGLLFGRAEEFTSLRPGDEVDICFTIQFNLAGSRPPLHLLLEDMRLSGEREEQAAR